MNFQITENEINTRIVQSQVGPQKSESPIIMQIIGLFFFGFRYYSFIIESYSRYRKSIVLKEKVKDARNKNPKEGNYKQYFQEVDSYG